MSSAAFSLALAAPLQAPPVLTTEAPVVEEQVAELPHAVEQPLPVEKITAHDFLGVDLGQEIQALLITYGPDLTDADRHLLGKIAYCESYNAQYDYQGEPLWSATSDVGAFQINIGNHEHARSKGLDVVNSLKDNTIFAIMLYRSSGTQPWENSEYCWSKDVPSWD